MIFFGDLMMGMYFTLFSVALGLAADAFAVSLCIGLEIGRVKIKDMIVTGLWFGGFQALMPTVGYLLGNYMYDLINAVDHWIAFALLSLIGINMIREGRHGKTVEEVNGKSGYPDFCRMLVMAVATSVDALAVGITLPTAVGSGLLLSVSVIGFTAFLLSAVGVRLGARLGTSLRTGAETAGGVILVAIALKILVGHLMNG